MLRALVVGWAGWLVCSRGAGGLGRAGLSGVLVFFVDHPVATSVVFLVSALYDNSGNTSMAIGGVMISFLMFAPLAFVVGVIGGATWKWVGRQNAPDT
jgi:hypothetical protein